MTTARCIWIGLALTSTARADEAVSSEQIEIHDPLPDPARTRISIDDAKQVPGALGDPVRAITALPGVVPIALDSAYFYVRGAPPGDVSYAVDGVRVPLVFHAGVATSVIPSPLVAAVDLYASAPPARIGGVAGGAIELVTPPPATRLHGEVIAKLYEAGALVETPLVGDRATVLAAARIGYPQLITAVVSPSSHVDYWDYQTRGTWQLDRCDRLALFAFGSHDRYAHDELGARLEDLAADFHRVELRLDHSFGDRGSAAGAISAGWSRVGASSSYARDLSLAARGDVDVQVAGSLRLRGGGHLDLDSFAIDTTSGVADPANGSVADAAPPPTNVVGGAYVDAPWQIAGDVQLVPGLRVDVYRSARSVATATIPVVEPRLALRWRVRDDVALVTSAGLGDQLPLLRVGAASATAVSVPGFPAGDLRLQRAAQLAQGIEVLLPRSIVATATVFASQIAAESDLPGTCYGMSTGPRDMPGPVVYTCADARSDARAYGLELSIRRSLSQRLGGIVSYTLSRTTERYSDGTSVGPYDRTHVLSAALGYAIGRGWRAGARFVFYSGVPYLQFVGGERAATMGDLRLPSFARLDLRAEHVWHLRGDRTISLVIDVMNATASREYTRVDCGPPYAPAGTCVPSAAPLFFLPSAGVDFTF